MIKVLVVEDSTVIQDLLCYIINNDASCTVVGVANNGEEAIELVKKKRPDVITMDIHMPKMDGLKTTRKIMETFPTPIIVVSSTFINGEVPNTFAAIEAGAIAVLHRPSGLGHPDFDTTSAELIRTIKLMSEVKVVRRWPSSQSILHKVEPIKVTKTDESFEGNLSTKIVDVVAIGASTGGPVVLQTILAGLTKNYPCPILIVQHIAKGFLQGFVEWLADSCELPIHVAAHREQILQSNVYVAPDNYQMKVDSSRRIVLTKDDPEHNLRPSVSYLFRSIPESFGPRAVGILLTGMGVDGAKELKLMRERGALTIAQDADSSVVHGMPGAAIDINAATYVLSPEKIVMVLKSILNNK